MSRPKQGKWLDISFSVGEYHGDTKDTENIEITITSGKCSECGRYSYRIMQYSATMPKYCSHCGRMMENGKD